MPKIGSGDNKELIFFAILFVLDIFYDVIRDVIGKSFYVCILIYNNNGTHELMYRVAQKKSGSSSIM